MIAFCFRPIWFIYATHIIVLPCCRPVLLMPTMLARQAILLICDIGNIAVSDGSVSFPIV